MLKTTALLILMASSALATPAVENDPCVIIGDTAGEIMKAHQAGVPLARVMEIMGVSDFWRSVVLNAYGTPRYRTDDYQDRAVIDFTTDIMLICYRSME